MFINELFDKDFYESIPPEEKGQYRFGDIYWTHTYYPHENLECWRPCEEDYEPTKTFADKFRIELNPKQPFNSLTLERPKLKSNEEFILIRAKQRPVLMLLPQMEIGGISPLNRGAKIWRRLCLVAQVFSVADKESNKLKFPLNFLDNVKRLKYPQLLFLPKQKGVFEVDGLARLDECQSIFTNHLQPTGFRLSSPLADLFLSQFIFLLDKIEECVYSEIKELLESE